MHLLRQESLQAQYQIGQRVWVPPILGTYYSMQNTNWPPLPCLPLDVAVYSLAINGTEAYAYDDRDVNYSEMESSLQSGGPGTPDGPHWPSPDDYGPSDLWLSITNTHTNFVLVTLHNDPQYLYEQIQTKTDLVRQVEWTPGNDWPSFLGDDQ